MDRLNQKTKEVTLVNNALQNPEAFGAIMHEFTNPLRRYIKRLSNLRDDEVESVLQDSFIKLYENLNDFDPELSLSSWLYRITHNQTIDFVRKLKVHAKPFGEFSDEYEEVLEKTADNINIETDIDKTFLKKHIFEVLNKLDPKYRNVLVLRFMEDQSYSEIADILKKPPGTIATLLNRAKKRFKKEAEKYKLENKTQ